jgi:hypothetical protein
MGVCRQFPRKLVFSTLDYLGLNFLHLYYLQEIARIKDIIFHTFNDSLTGKLYKSSMELFFIELGIDPQYSCLDPNIIEALTTPTLIKSTMLFLVKNNIQIKHPISILPQREHDQFIMTVLLQFPIPIHELLACNQCRLFLKAWFISDIATGDRRLITEEAWTGQHVNTSSKAQSWPYHPKPSRATWLTWQKWISKAFLSRGRRFRQPLGKWLRWEDSWKWFTSAEGELYSLSHGTWYSHTPVIRRNRLPMFSKERTVCSAPSTIHRATTYVKGGRIVCTGSAAIVKTPTHPLTSLMEHLHQSVPGWCLQTLEITEEGRPLVDALMNGLSATIMAVSDGSFKNTFGTAAWTTRTEDRGNLLTGSVVCPGTGEDQSAYRSELTGLYVIMTIINQLCQYYSITDGHVEIGCDGLSALQTVFEQGTALTSDIPDFDLVGAILHLRKTSKVTWTH